MAPNAKASSLVVRRLYRSLLRTTKPFTSPSPNARILNCLLHRTGIDDHIGDWEAFVTEDPNPVTTEDRARDLTHSYGVLENETNTVPANQTCPRLFRRLLREVVAGSQYGVRKLNFPSQVDPTRLREIVRREFRDGSSSQSIHFTNATRRQVAFTALRELNKKLSYFDDLQQASPEISPAQAAANVSPLPFSPPSSYLKPGAFLISHPHMNDSFFAKTVICILEDKSDMDDSALKRSENPGQTYGLIINRVSINTETGKTLTLEEAFEKHLLPGRLAEVFGDTMVREGGPVHVAIQMLHALSPTQEDKDATAIGGSVIPTIPEDNESSTALYSDRGAYFQGDIMKAMVAVDSGSLSQGTLATGIAYGTLVNDFLF